MGCELVSDSLSQNGAGEKPASFTYTEIFEAQCPYYLSIGMTYKQYWHGDCCAAKYLREAEKLKNQKKNQELWLQGLYIYEALLNSSAALKSFPGKDAKIIPYPEQPYPLTTSDRERIEEEKARKALEANKNRMSAWAAEFNSKFKKSNGGDENA